MVRRRAGAKVSFDRLRAPGQGDVRDRIEAVYVAVDALGAEDLNLTPAPVLDMVVRAERLHALEALADRAGRRAIMDVARDQLKDTLVKRWTSRLTLAYGMESIQTGRVEDRAAIVTALRDLVAVAVMRDLVSDEEAFALAGPGLRIVGASDFAQLDAMTTVEGDAPDDEPAEPDGSGDEDEVVPERLIRGEDARPGAPTADDWKAAAAEARTREAGFRPEPVAILFGVLAVVGLFAVLAMRVERTSVVSGLVLVGALLAGIVVVLRLVGRGRG